MKQTRQELEIIRETGSKAHDLIQSLSILKSDFANFIVEYIERSDKPDNEKGIMILYSKRFFDLLFNFLTEKVNEGKRAKKELEKIYKGEE